MPLLHPLFYIVILGLIIYSFLEVYNKKNYKSLWLLGGFMIILIGTRRWVGADYGEYVKMFHYFGNNIEYSRLFDKALFGGEQLDVEWQWIFWGKIFHNLYLPFFFFTFFSAILSLGLKFFTFGNSVVYPALSILLYMFPSYFSADGGHMRQAIAMGFTMASFYFIKKRQLLFFLFMIYMAVGFHKSSFIFIFAYWIVLIPMTPKRILAIVILSVILSPLEVYKYISVLDSIAPADVYQGFQAYEMIEEQNKGSVKFTDLICIMYTYFLVTYNKEGEENILYYEYMRNIGVVGICMYFIFRGSAIFSSRLSAYYFIFMIMVLPNIIAAIRVVKVRKTLHLFVILYALFYMGVYTYMQSYRAGYSIEIYNNHLW